MHLFQKHLTENRKIFKGSKNKDTDHLNEKYQTMRNGDLLQYVKIIDKEKKNKILGKRSKNLPDEYVVFEITKVPLKKRGRKKLELDG